MATLTERRERELLPGPAVMRQVGDILSRPDRRIGYVWGTLRLGMGWIFLWAFVDKLFGLGYATASESAWISGGSPTSGFLNFATKGPFVELYKGMAGSVAIDWLFMLGLLAIGLPLILGIGVRLAAATGVLMLGLMYTAASILPEHNPFLDDHIVYAVIMVGLILVGSGRHLGLGNMWAKTRLVRKYPILE